MTDQLKQQGALIDRLMGDREKVSANKKSNRRQKTYSSDDVMCVSKVGRFGGDDYELQ